MVRVCGTERLRLLPLLGLPLHADSARSNSAFMGTARKGSNESLLVGERIWDVNRVFVCAAFPLGRPVLI